MKRSWAVVVLVLLFVSCGGGGGGGGGFSIIGFFLNAILGQPYSQQFGVTPGTAPYGWSFSGGLLPNGLNFCPPTGDASDITKCTISGTPTQSGDFPIILRVADSTAPNPQVATKSVTLHVAAALSITSAALPNGVRGTAYNQTITSTGGNAPFTWSRTGNLPPGVNFCPAAGDAANHSNCTLSGNPTTVGTYPFTVTVKDSTNPQASASQNENVQIQGTALSIVTTSLPNGTTGTTYNQTVAAVGGFAPYTWTLTPIGGLPPNVAFCSTATGLTCNLAGLLNQPGVFPFQIAITDNSPIPQNANQNYSVTIDSPAMSITSPPTLPNGVQGQAYTSTNIVSTGGYGPYTWDITAGQLPPDLALCPAETSFTCQVSGNLSATSAGTYSPTVRVRDSTPNPPGQKSATKVFSNVIIYTPLAITSTSPLPDGVQGVAYNQPLNATGGTGAYTWVEVGNSLSARGLSLTSAGVVTGTPTSSGAADFTARVTDTSVLPGGAQTAQQAFALNVRPPQVAITTNSLPNGVVNHAYNQTIVAVNGTLPYVWTYTGTLPPGVTFCTGAIGLSCSLSTGAGTLTTQGNNGFTVRITDSVPQFNEKPYTVEVYPELDMTSTSPLPDAIQGQAYNQTLTAVGGQGPHTWAVTAGVLPAGLIMCPVAGDAGNGLNCTLTGVPTGSGAANFTVRITDSSILPGGPQQSEVTFQMTVRPALTFVTASPLPPGVQNVPYPGNIQAQGGNGGPYTWDITVGILPAGLQLCPVAAGLNCPVTGTPTTVGSQTFTVRVRDFNAQQTATKQYTLQINAPPPPGWTETAITNATAGSNYISGAINPSNSNLHVGYRDAATGPNQVVKSVNWSSPETIESRYTACRAGTVGNYIRMAMLPDGIPYAAYQDASNGCSGGGGGNRATSMVRKAPVLPATCLDTSSGPWCEVSRGIGTTQSVQGFEIAFDTSKTPGSKREMMLFRHTGASADKVHGGSCDDQICSWIVMPWGIASWPSLYIDYDADGNQADVYMSYQKGDSWLHFSHCTTITSCSTSPADVLFGAPFELLNTQQGATSIILTPAFGFANRYVWIAYQGGGAATGGAPKLRATRCLLSSPTACDIVSSWSPEWIVDNPGGVKTGFMPEIRLDTAGNPHITYMECNGLCPLPDDPSATFTGRHAWWDGATWQNEGITGLTSIKAISHVIDGSNVIHVFAIKATGEVVEVTKAL